MAEKNDKPISQFEERTVLSGNEMIPFAESGKNGKIKSSLLKGLKGDKGDKGDTGAKGEKGDPGLKGDKGDAGKSAYQLAVDGGYKGTEAEFSSILSGLPEQELTVDKLSKQVAKNTGDIKSLNEFVYEDEYYGIEFDTAVSSPECTRIGKVELHKSLPAHNLRGCLLNDNGDRVKYLNEKDWTGEVLDGSQGQVMVEISHYRRFETDGTKRRVKLSKYPLAGYHQVRMYVSAYQATVERSTSKLASVKNTSAGYRGGSNNASWDGTYRSSLGVPATSINLTNFRNYARKRKAGSSEWNCMLYEAQKALYWLFAVEYATLDTQKAYNAELTAEGFRQGGLGAGVTNLDWGKWSAFNGNNPFVPCGFTDSLGNGTGTMPFTMPDEYGTLVTNVPRYRGIENPFGHVWHWTDGIKVRISPTVENGGDGLSKVFICKDPALFKDSGYDGYTYVGDEARNEGYVKEVIFGDGGEIMPLVCTGGGSTTYHCDYHYTNIPTAETPRGVLFGGHAASGSRAGFACATSGAVPSSSNASVGSRLCFLPHE